MKKYIIKVEYEYEVEAEDEIKAEELFWDDAVYAPQSDPASFIAENTIVSEIK